MELTTRTRGVLLRVCQQAAPDLLGRIFRPEMSRWGTAKRWSPVRRRFFSPSTAQATEDQPLLPFPVFRHNFPENVARSGSSFCCKTHAKRLCKEEFLLRGTLGKKSRSEQVSPVDGFGLGAGKRLRS